jgi:N-acyl-D-aspartate/D-glutamate deacylase
VLAPGRKADVDTIDWDALAAGTPYITNDLPDGGRRFLQRATGYAATVVSGRITYRDGEPTEALPGRLVRGARSRSQP